jgi:hypothetical protein
MRRLATWQIFIATTSILVSSPNLGAAAEPLSVRVSGHAFSIDHEVRYGKHIFRLTYSNKSTIAHCIRSVDFGPSVYENAVEIVDQNGRRASYIGPYVMLTERALKKEFIIVPPGETVSEYLSVMQAYSLRGLARKNIHLRYGIAVADCSIFENGYADIPSLSAIDLPEDFSKDELDEVRAELSTGYRTWAASGFVAFAESFFDK